MNDRMVFASISCGLVALSCMWPAGVALAESGAGSPPVSQHAEQSFQQLQQTERGGKTNEQAGAKTTVAEHGGHYPTEQYLIGKGQGDLSKGKMVCQRVSELSARTDLAKQIRVMVKEHMVDRSSRADWTRVGTGHRTHQGRNRPRISPRRKDRGSPDRRERQDVQRDRRHAQEPDPAQTSTRPPRTNPDSHSVSHSPCDLPLQSITNIGYVTLPCRSKTVFSTTRCPGKILASDSPFVRSPRLVLPESPPGRKRWRPSANASRRLVSA